jgi:copper chaperone CopZ
MKKIIFVVFALSFVMLFSCGKQNDHSAGGDKMKNMEQKEKTPIDSNIIKTSLKVDLKCGSMTCTGCENTITKEVIKLEGVKAVEADFETKRVQVYYDDSKVSIDDIKAAIDKSGYKPEDWN